MSVFANLTAHLNLNIAGFSQNMQKASSMASKFAANLSGQINTGIIAPTKKSGVEFKDVARIVQGIMISKAFYGGMHAIKGATDAVWEFSKQLEYAQMVYTNMFGSAELATEFINVLKDFAAVTPFTFKQSEDAAKRLLAYGIEYQNIMYVMQGVLAAATVQGSDAVIEPVSRALGQIYTKGRLMNEEMRQLAEAGIPAYEILGEKLGLTSKQLQNLGKNAIPANIAINALVDGITDRFGGMMQYASMTINGLISNIKDNATMLASGLFSPMTESIRTVIINIAQFVAKFREIYELRGAGGVFENLIPPGLQQAVRQLIGNFTVFYELIKTDLAAALAIIRSLLVTVMHTINALAPAFLTLAGILTAFLKVLTSNATAMKVITTMVIAAAAAWAIYKVQALAALVSTAVVKVIIASVKGLIVALNFLVAHPVWALLAVGVGILVGLSNASDKFRNSIKGITSSFQSLTGVDSSKILLPESKERSADLGKFNNALDGTSKGMSDLADSTGKASKAAKALLGFDEVFSLKAPDEGNAAADWASMLDSFGDLGAGGIDLSAMDIQMPDVGEIANGFVDNLIAAIGGKEPLLSAGIGAILGAVIGAIFGGPAGIKIGAAIGAIGGWFWPQVADALTLTDAGTIALPIATGLGAAIGFLAGGPFGALIGGTIGLLVGWLVDGFTRGFRDADWSRICLPLGIGLGAGIGFLVGGPGGAAIGAGIGALVGWIADVMVENWDKISKGASDFFTSLNKDIDNFTVGINNSLDEGWAAIGAWYEDLLSDTAAFFVDMNNDLSKFETDLNAWIDRNWQALTDWFGGLGTDIGKFFDDLNMDIDDFSKNINDWLDSNWQALTDWFSRLGIGIGKFFDGLNLDIDGFTKSVNDWLDEGYKTVKEGIGNIYNIFKNWVSDMWTNVFNKVFGWLDSGISKLREFFKLEEKTTVPKTTTTTTGLKVPSVSATRGHAVGGVFNREHIARFAEGNKSEAIIPLENNTAMQPFVDAVADGLASVLMPMLSVINNQNGDQLRPLYVGTLIADERGLKELNRQMQIIELEEDARRG